MRCLVAALTLLIVLAVPAQAQNYHANSLACRSLNALKHLVSVGEANGFMAAYTLFTTIYRYGPRRCWTTHLNGVQQTSVLRVLHNVERRPNQYGSAEIVRVVDGNSQYFALRDR